VATGQHAVIRTPRLLVTDPLGRRQIIIDKPLVTLGRRSESDVRVGGAGVSRQHAEIVADNGSFRLRDCGSKFGTFVNGNRTDEHALVHGDIIRLGESQDTEIVFMINDDEDSRSHSAVSVVSELRHLAGLLEGLRALGSGRVLDDVLTLVLDAAITVTGAERGFIMLANAARKLEFKVARGRGQVTLSGRTVDISNKIPATVFDTGKDMIVEDLLDSEMAVAHTHTQSLGIRQVLCAPLRLVRFLERAEDRSGGDEKVIGVLYLDSRERGALKSHATRAALETLSMEAAVAIENARLYREALERAKLDQELKVAAAIQQALLPPSNRDGAFFSTAGTSVPCRSVGGDFFDFVDLPHDRFGFIVGDVAGKGAPAALLAANAVGMFGAEATYQTGAASVVRQINQGIFRRGIEGRFLTAFYGILAGDGTLTYSNAGHNAPVLVGGSGVKRLEAGGMVLGLFDHATYDEETLILSPGDVIVAFSDGVSEALNAEGEEYSDARLLASVNAHRGGSPKDLLAALLADVHAFCGEATPSDDVTMVVVRYEGGQQ
jgi:serine phosphatase RsbU (regulator of sigma subunit)